MEENPAKKAEIKEEQKKLEEQTIIALAANRLDKPKENNIIKCECSCKC